MEITKVGQSQVWLEVGQHCFCPKVSKMIIVMLTLLWDLGKWF